MFVHRVRKLTAQEELDFAGAECNFGHWNDHAIPPATHRVFGTEGGHRVGNICCDRCAAELRADIRSRAATPVTHGEPDATYDGRWDYVSPMLYSRNGPVGGEVPPLAVGAEHAFSANGRRFVLKRLSRQTWHLRDEAITSRSRFGTRKEITEDVRAVLESGALPGPDGPRW